MASWTELEWLNAPNWQVDGETLVVTTDAHTDFWRETHYGFVRDSGHFLHAAVPGEFTAQVRVEGAYRSLYDQAGLMVRADEAHWVKTGVEFVGHQQLSAVVTQPYSDWNVRPVGTPAWVEIRMTRRGNALSVQTRLPGEDWQLLRLTFWPPDLSVSVGIYACSPGDAGFEVYFSDFSVQAPADGPLY